MVEGDAHNVQARLLDQRLHLLPGELVAAREHASYTNINVKTRVSDPGFFQIPDPGVCTSNGEIFLNVYKMNVLDTIKRHLFCIYTFVVRRPMKALEPRIRIRSEFSPDPGL